MKTIYAIAQVVVFFILWWASIMAFFGLGLAVGSWVDNLDVGGAYWAAIFVGLGVILGPFIALKIIMLDLPGWRSYPIKSQE